MHEMNATSGNELHCDSPIDIGLGTRRKTNHELGRSGIVLI
jgi:hypothetical protein